MVIILLTDDKQVLVIGEVLNTILCMPLVFPEILCETKISHRVTQRLNRGTQSRIIIF